MDSTGANSLFHLHKRVDGLGRRLVVVSPTDAVRMVLEILGLDQVIDIHV
jgi:anti-anti-sigma factor